MLATCDGGDMVYLFTHVDPAVHGLTFSHFLTSQAQL